MATGKLGTKKSGAAVAAFSRSTTEGDGATATTLSEKTTKKKGVSDDSCGGEVGVCVIQ